MRVVDQILFFFVTITFGYPYNIIEPINTIKMRLFEAYSKALDLINKHTETGELSKGWKFAFDRAKTRYGCCKYSKKTITLSKVLVPHMEEKDVIDTILHEIAHAIVGAEHGHDEVWRAKAIEIGCNGMRCGNKVDKEKMGYKYVGTCPNGHKTYRHRLSKRVRESSSCAKCESRYNPELRFEWELNKKS